MNLLPIQRRFIALFVSDGTYDLMTTCAASGVLPSKAMEWFRDDGFQAAIRRYEGAQLAAMGYGPLRVIRDTLAIAHSDITQALPLGPDGEFTVRDLSALPRDVRVTVKKVKMGVAIGTDGRAVVYPKEVEMHDKTWALKQASEWFDVSEAPEVKKAQAVKGEDGPRRISGLVVRPPLTKEEKDVEDLLS